MSGVRERLALLEARSREERSTWRMPAFAGIDPGLPFVPEPFTQLYHLPVYETLSPHQRLRYNQLFGLRTNEMFMVFEKGVTAQLIGHLKSALGDGDRVLADCLEGMLVEEARHHRMFLQFNRRFLPEGYGRGGRCFSRDSVLERGLLPLLGRYSGFWPLLLWAVLVLEEFSTAFSRWLLKCPGLEPAYLGLHRQHLKDEMRHVQLDEILLNRLMDATGSLARIRDGRLFQVFFRRVLSPRHSGPNVVRYLAREDPSLESRCPEMLRQLRRLPRDPGLTRLLEDPEAMPVTHAMLGRYPGFRWFES